MIRTRSKSFFVIFLHKCKICDDFLQIKLLQKKQKMSDPGQDFLNFFIRMGKIQSVDDLNAFMQQYWQVVI